MNCVLCRIRTADTAEHTFKSDIYQKTTGDGKSWLIRGDEPMHKINGRNSKRLKPVKNLCGICNNENSQEADAAFSKIHEHLWKTERVAGNTIDLNVIEQQFGADSLIHLKRYFAKLLACIIHQGNHPVPDVLGDIFLNSAPLEKLNLSVSVDTMSLYATEGIEGDPKEVVPFDYIYNTPLIGNYKRGDEVKPGAMPVSYTFAVIASDIRYDVTADCSSS